MNHETTKIIISLGPYLGLLFFCGSRVPCVSKNNSASLFACLVMVMTRAHAIGIIWNLALDDRGRQPLADRVLKRLLEVAASCHSLTSSYLDKLIAWCWLLEA